MEETKCCIVGHINSCACYWMLSFCCSQRHNTRAYHFLTKSIQTQQTGRKKVETENSMHRRAHTHSQQTRILGTVRCCIRIIWMSGDKEKNVAGQIFHVKIFIFWVYFIYEVRKKSLRKNRTHTPQILEAPIACSEKGTRS